MRPRLQVGPDERAIREVHSTWIDAVNAGDLARLLTLMADDVVFLNPGQAPFGRDGFSADRPRSWDQLARLLPEPHGSGANLGGLRDIPGQIETVDSHTRHRIQ